MHNIDFTKIQYLELSVCSSDREHIQHEPGVLALEVPLLLLLLLGLGEEGGGVRERTTCGVG